MRKLVLAALAIGLTWLIYNKLAEPPYEPPPGYKAAMDHFAKEVDADVNGNKGEEARAVCRRIAGVNVSAKTYQDVTNAGYSNETAQKYMDCMMHYLYPVDAKVDAEYRRKAGVH